MNTPYTGQPIDQNLSVEAPGMTAPTPSSVPQFDVASASALAMLAQQQTQKSRTVSESVDPNSIEAFLRNKHHLQGELPVIVRRVVTNLTDYIQVMNPNRPTAKDELGRTQRKLWNTYVIALNADPADAFLCLDAILFAFERNYSTVFNDRVLWRAIDAVNIPYADLRTFQFLGTLFANTAYAMQSQTTGAKPTKRALARTQLRQVVESLQTAEAQQNLTSYYSSN